MCSFKGLRCAAILTLCWAAQASAATIVLVRHADRTAGMSADALLNPAGEKRAQVLAEVLQDAHIQRIYVTEVRRVQQTAEPLAARLHLKPIVIPVKDVDGLVSQLRALGEDETVLVVGHKDNLPEVIEKLGGGKIPPFADPEYDRMIVLCTGAGKTRILTLRYGAPAH